MIIQSILKMYIEWYNDICYDVFVFIDSSDKNNKTSDYFM